MKKLIALSLMLVVMSFGLPAFADDAVTAGQVTGTFEKYVAQPVQWVHQGAWGVLTVAFRIGKAPVDKAFELVGSFLGSEPNVPLWK